MSKIKLIDDLNPTCPIRNILSRICDKWSLLVLLTLSRSESGVIRFKELQRLLPDISQKMLTVTLRTLEEDGLVSRHAYAVVPPKVEYSLTERSQTLLPSLNPIIAWAKENMTDIISERTQHRA
ncbi:MAG: helix-turn-helix domain-containing protein [Rikenellaceae bacterium]